MAYSLLPKVLDVNTKELSEPRQRLSGDRQGSRSSRFPSQRGDGRHGSATRGYIALQRGEGTPQREDVVHEDVGPIRPHRAGEARLPQEALEPVHVRTSHPRRLDDLEVDLAADGLHQFGRQGVGQRVRRPRAHSRIGFVRIREGGVRRQVDRRPLNGHQLVDHGILYFFAVDEIDQFGGREHVVRPLRARIQLRDLGLAPGETRMMAAEHLVAAMHEDAVAPLPRPGASEVVRETLVSRRGGGCGSRIHVVGGAPSAALFGQRDVFVNT